MIVSFDNNNNNMIYIPALAVIEVDTIILLQLDTDRQHTNNIRDLY